MGKVRQFEFIFLIIFVPILCLGAAPEKESYSDELKTAARLTAEKKWDLAEADYLKALKSSYVGQRIRSCEGLLDIYSFLHYEKKAALIKAQLRKEKIFEAKLVPKEDSYYESYLVKKGDTYHEIALKKKISFEWFARANQRKPLKVGEEIRLPKIHDCLVVDKKSKTLTWKRNAEVVKVYPIAIGQEGMETPEGGFEIVNKVAHPIWYKLGQEYPPDSPENLLGTRWMGLNRKGYGIHGTRHPGTIGSAASHGCIRMFNRDVEELFRWIPIGTKVEIRQEASDK